ncbi:hypothetical protein BBJ28_00011998 [Nothophytophthora sp. Chile5]|nr:hypothetical protein BBJ28_00011998 [Nothophytophthora sp. Chile5]
MHWKLRVLLDVAVALLLLALDVRDLWYKTQWLGPGDVYAFATKTSLHLLDSPPTGADQSADESSTGWRAFRASCSELHALSGDGRHDSGHPHFLHVLAANCSAGDGLTEDLQPQFKTMVLTSDVRADAMAWAACKLLYVSRRPPLCQAAMVSNFLAKYRFAAPHVTSPMMAAPMSAAERELRELLDVIGKSQPLSAMVCVGGVELPDANEPQQEPEQSLNRIFGCASPNLPGKSVMFVGQHATAFASLQLDKTRLTVDDVDVLDMHLLFRQNAVRTYHYHPPNATNPSDLQPQTFPGHMTIHTALNLSCSGFLYNLLVLTDLVLLVLHAWSASELLSRFVLPPLLRTPTKQELRDLTKGEGRTTLFACILARSPSVAALTLTSTLLSWLLLLPHTAVWALSTDEFSASSFAVMNTLLSAIRVWMLLLLLVYTLWDALVYTDEARAYMLATRTFVSSSELVAAVALAGLLLRHRLLSVLPQKHEMEKQRIVDAAAFPGRLATSNAYEDAAYSLYGRERDLVLWLIYWPLVELLLLALLLVALGMTIRYLLHEYRRHAAAKTAATTVGVNATEGSEHLTSSRPSTAGFSSAKAVIAGYSRLPLEELLDVPIRAKHIVRSGGSEPIGSVSSCLEKTVGQEQFLWPVQYLAHGVLLENDRYLSTRRGFYRVLPVHEPMDGGGARSSSSNGRSGKAAPQEGNGSPKRRRYTTTYPIVM